MIIAPAYKTLFFAIPRTASKAISKAMVDHLGATEEKPMHKSYAEFHQAAGRRYRSYFSFATVRNPMDSVVSAYFKKKSDHNGRFSRGAFKNGRPIASRGLAEYQFILENNADFAAYFAKFHTSEYRVPRHEATLNSVDRVLRYETLADDYAQLIEDRGWPAHTLPVFNTTAGKGRDYRAYYTPAIHDQAREYFSEFCGRWGYAEALNEL